MSSNPHAGKSTGSSHNPPPTTNNNNAPFNFRPTETTATNSFMMTDDDMMDSISSYPHKRHRSEGQQQIQQYHHQQQNNNDDDDDDQLQMPQLLGSCKRSRSNTYKAPKKPRETFVSVMGTLVGNTTQHGHSTVRVRRQLSGSQLEQFLGTGDKMDEDFSSSTQARERSMSL